MSYDAILAAEIAAGEPVTQDLLAKIKGNDADFSTRLTAAEGSILTTQPMGFVVSGEHSAYGAYTGMSYLRVPYNCTLTGAKLYIPNIGVTGTLTVDVQKSAAGGGAFATIFSVKPSVAVAAGNHGVSTNAVLSTTSLLAGDILRLDISVVQIGCNQFHLYLTHEVA